MSSIVFHRHSANVAVIYKWQLGPPPKCQGAALPVHYLYHHLKRCYISAESSEKVLLRARLSLGQ